MTKVETQSAAILAATRQFEKQGLLSSKEKRNDR
jgi:hypothetical protein